MACRESADLFWWIGRYGIGDALKSKLWRRPYFWQDTFWMRFNRVIGCRLGHRHVDTVYNQETGVYDRPYCFACKRNVGGK